MQKPRRSVEKIDSDCSIYLFGLGEMPGPFYEKKQRICCAVGTVSEAGNGSVLGFWGRKGSEQMETELRNDIKRAAEKQYTPYEIRRNMQKMQRSDGGVVCLYEDETGSICSTSYTPFRGVSFVQKEVHMPRFVSNWRYGPVDAVAIEYCTEGRLECQVGEDCLYISPGDVVISRTDPHSRELQYPSCHYHAYSFVFYLQEPSEVLNLHLKMAGFTMEMLLQKYLPNQKYFNVLKQAEPLKELFHTMSKAPESIKTTYIGIKSLESLVLLSANIVQIEEKLPKKISRHQAELVKQVYRYVMEHPEERFSIEELAAQFHISATHLKTCFQIVYGMPMQKFIREQKMKAAAAVLEMTNDKVTDVAQMFGYSNISKFAESFKSVMGEHPKHYSMHHRRTKQG